jgi:hypothetical protein
MAVETGTASDGADLYSKLVSFLTTNTDLVAAGQEWSEVWSGAGSYSTDKVLRGPGLAGTDSVYVGMRYTANVATEAYAIRLVGMTGYLASATQFNEHINVTPDYVRMFLDANPMTYWFVANGRRFIVVAKIGTVYETLYGGLILPYALPTAYPLPLFIGGSAGPEDSDGPANWRSVSDAHCFFAEPYYSSSVEASAWMLSPEGTWLRVADTGTATSCAVYPGYIGSNGEYFGTDTNNAYLAPQFVLYALMEGYGGDRALWPCAVLNNVGQGQTYGLLDGVNRCQGYGNAAENIITVSSVDHLVVPNVFRSSFRNYMTVALE